MAAKRVDIGGRSFSRQLDAINFFKDMLARYSVGERVSDVDAVDLHALLLRHIDRESKIGKGVDHFEVQKDGYGGRCFWVVRVDGTQVDFTYRRCITGIW